MDVKLTHDGNDDNDVVLFVLDLIVIGRNDDKGVEFSLDVGDSPIIMVDVGVS